MRRRAEWNPPNRPSEKFVRNDFTNLPTRPSGLSTSSTGFNLSSGAAFTATERSEPNVSRRPLGETWRTSTEKSGSDSWPKRDEPIFSRSEGRQADVMKSVIAAVLPNSGQVQKPLPNDISSKTESRVSQEKIAERSNPVEQAKLEKEREDLEKIAQVKSELESMRRDDKEGFEMLLRVVKEMNDPRGGYARSSLFANASPAIKSLSTNQLIMRALFGGPVSTSKASGNLEFSQSSDPKNILPSKDSVPAVPIKSTDSANIPDTKILSSSAALPAPDPPCPSQPRWESWRNLGSREPGKPSNEPVAPPSDSWRTTASSSASSASWRSDSKTVPNSSPLKKGQPWESQPSVGADRFRPQQTMISDSFIRSRANDRGQFMNRPLRRW
ncbi:unnamed protein product [Haemonchus placei]|uniref:WH2 domain-containing protein n=1 Tax=Haemonchus placei TaxID=6290 RepID=A0A0N4W0Y8_HAEPC|nr:unnamed protein product [Haemonchus placei]